jgi:hypothetical protein
VYAFRLKTGDISDRRSIEGKILTKFEWYCQVKKNINLEKSPFVEFREFKGFQIPDELLEYLETEKNGSILINKIITDTKDIDKDLEAISEDKDKQD